MDKESIFNNWNKICKRTGSYFPYTLILKGLIRDAYNAGAINWNVYQAALERIKRTENGTWMFEEK